MPGTRSTRPSRWRALTAALLCPLSVWLSVGSITESWRTDPSSGLAQPTHHDTHLLLASQCLVFVLDMIASTTLIVRFLSADARRSTLVAAACLTASTVLVAISAIIFSHRLDLDDLSTTFWLAVAASIVTAVVDALLIWEFFRTRQYKLPLTRIAVKQRSLVATFYVFILYLSCGSIMFKFASGFSYLDAAYFMIQSILTCGFGDLALPDFGSRLATMLYFPVGIVLTGVLIAQMRNTVMEAAKRKIMLKFEEEASPEVRDKAERSGFVASKAGQAGQEAAEAATTYEESLRSAVKTIQEQQGGNYRQELLFAFGLFFMFWLIGALVFSRLEGFNYFMALYFCFIAFSSIGYGDLSPTTPGGRAFYIGWGMMGIVCLTILFSVISDAWLDGIQENMRHFLSHRLKVFRRAGTTGNSPEDEKPTAQRVSTRRSSSGARDEESTSEIIGDLHAHLRALLRRDHVNMRSRLRELFEEKRREHIEPDDRGEEEELNDALLDDDDETVKLLLLKHCDIQLQKLIDRTKDGTGRRDGETRPSVHDADQ